MDLQTVLAAVRSWPTEDRLRLIEGVRESLSDGTPEAKLPGELTALLDRRLDAHPDDVLTWDEIRAYVRRPR